jgi:CRISPR-associated protein Csm5
MKTEWDNITLETVTPIHIGNGEKYTFLDYFVDGGKANILNTDSIFGSVNEDIEVINNLSKDIEEKIINGQAEINVKDFFRGYDVDVSKHIIKTIKTDIEHSRRVEVKQFINQNGRCYFPGSSIKGAIRTAYIFDYFNDGRNINELVSVLEDANVRIKKGIKPHLIKFSEIEEIAIGKIQDDCFRHLLVSDSEFITDGQMSMIETKRYSNEKKKYKEHSVYLEVLDANESVNFKIKINKGFGKTIKDIRNSLIKLSKTVSDYEKNNPNNPVFLKEFYEYLSKDIHENETVYMNLGFGGGYLPKTIYLLLPKYGKDLNIIKEILPFSKDKQRKRELVNAFTDFPMTKTVYNEEPIGWVKLNFP